MCIIKANNVIKSYRTGQVVTRVLNGVSFSVDSGDFYAIRGESGSGKSTLLHVLSGQLNADGGEVFLLGRELRSINGSEMARLRREEMSFIFQDFCLAPTLNALDNVLLPAMLGGGRADYDGASDMLKAVGLDGKQKNYPSQLSGGQQQRVALARAVFSKPKIIFADEPTGNLDAESGKMVMELLTDFHKQFNCAILLVTHSDESARYASKHITLRDGRIVQAGNASPYDW